MRFTFGVNACPPGVEAGLQGPLVVLRGAGPVGDDGFIVEVKAVSGAGEVVVGGLGV